MPSQSAVTNQKLYQARLLLTLAASSHRDEARALEAGAVGHLYGAWRSYLLELAEQYKKTVLPDACELQDLAEVLPGVQEVRVLQILCEDQGSWLSRLLSAFSRQWLAQGHVHQQDLIGVDTSASPQSWLLSFEQLVELQRESRQEF